MKKILISIAIVLMIGMSAGAQNLRSNDSFFNDWDDVSNGLDKIGLYEPTRDPIFPGGHGGGDTPAPLGSGIAVLLTLGAGYALKKRK